MLGRTLAQHSTRNPREREPCAEDDVYDDDESEHAVPSSGDGHARTIVPPTFYVLHPL